MALALQGLRVIDLAQGVSGAFCAMQLGDLGADVVKVEPTGGDWLRTIGPFQEGESAIFLQVNRNKRGIALDLKQPEGAAILQAMLGTADIAVESYRPGVMDRLGFGYEAVSAANPRIIYCSISGYGEEGPLGDAPGTELDIQAVVGANRHLGVAGEPPVRFGIDLASTGAGMAGFQAVMAALLWRARTGAGQRVRTSLLAALTAMYQWTLTAEHAPDTWEGRPLTGLTDPPDHGFFTADGPALITLRGNEEGWTRFLIAIGRPEVLMDERFSTPEMLMEHINDLPPVINDTLSGWSFERLRALVQGELGGTIVRMHTMSSLLEDPQVQALEMVQTIEGHPTAGPVRTLNVPWGFAGDLASLRTPAPVLGQHTDEVLRELGYSREDINRLVGRGVVSAWTPPTVPA